MALYKRIYLIGDAFVSFRARALFEFLMASPEYVFHHSDPRFLMTTNKSFFKRLLFRIFRIFDKFLSLHKLVISDIIYILPMGNLIGVEKFISKMLRKKVIGEFYISMLDTYVNDRKIVLENSLKASKLLKLDQNLIDVCNQIVFLNSSEREYYLNLIERQTAYDKTLIIPLATNYRLRSKLPYANLKSSTITLCWWGTFLPLHGLDKIIEAAKYLKLANIDFKLYLFGNSTEKALPYKNQLINLGLESHVFFDYYKNFADKSLENFLIDNCDIAFGNFGDSFKAKTVMVNKVVESISMGLPVISQRTSALNEYFTDLENIIFCESEALKIAEKVIMLSKERNLLNDIGNAGYLLFEKHFSKEAYLNQIIPLLKT
ncbi:glycosyltransferase [Belliella sp. DSM 111904]|uniref:Glycosyltransferase n=1 Tax=Belliella filtrata TaxID=2923435 RepID=A0ABS9UZW0_9BACT|nr:glycosyltransferase [Belliella filtrata]MCH7409683.1 glycosyltransferase [Belliella filtrata]